MQAEHDTAERGLAAAGLADKRKGLALVDIEGDTVDGPHHLRPAEEAAAQVVVLGQVAGGKDRLVHCATPAVSVHLVVCSQQRA